MPLHVQTDRVIKDSGLRTMHVRAGERREGPDPY